MLLVYAGKNEYVKGEVHDGRFIVRAS